MERTNGGSQGKTHLGVALRHGYEQSWDDDKQDGVGERSAKKVARGRPGALSACSGA